VIVAGAAAIFFVVVFALSVRTRRQMAAQDEALTSLLAENAQAMKRLDDSLKSGLVALQEYRDANPERGDRGSGSITSTDAGSVQQRPTGDAKNMRQRIPGVSRGAASVAGKVLDAEVSPSDPRYTPALEDILKAKKRDWAVHIYQYSPDEADMRAHDVYKTWNSSLRDITDLKLFHHGFDKQSTGSAAMRHDAIADKHEITSKVKRHPAEAGQPPVLAEHKWQEDPWRTDLGELLALAGWDEHGTAHDESQGGQRSTTSKSSSTC
jgi:hypothetical protein